MINVWVSSSLALKASNLGEHCLVSRVLKYHTHNLYYLYLGAFGDARALIN